MTVYVATTFREFDGSENDRIQRLFLDRLSSERYCKLKLKVTTFGEKSVSKVLQGYNVDCDITEEAPFDCRFSLTQVLSNAINNQNFENEDLVIWTTCDVIFSDDFFLKASIANNAAKSNISIISHPHLIYRDTESLDKGIYEINGPADGIDFVGFSGAKINKQFKQDIADNFFSDWGVFEHFLVAVAVKNNFKRINLYEQAPAKKICNDREVNNEDEQYFRISLNKNWPVFNRFLVQSSLSREFYSLVYCNLLYDLPTILSGFRYRLKFSISYVAYFKALARGYLVSYLPPSTKKRLKEFLAK